MAEPVLTPLRRLTCKLTKADYEALLKRFEERPIPLSLVVAAAIFVGLGWGAIDPGWYGELALLPIIAVAAAVLYGLAHVWRRMRRAQRLARWTPPAAPIEVEVFTDHLTLREDGRTRVYAWDDILSVALDEGRVYLVKSRDEIVILPLAAFENHRAMCDFVLLCEDLMREPGDQAPAAERPARSTLFRSEGAVKSSAEGALEGVDVTMTAQDALQVEGALQRRGAGPTFGFAMGALMTGLLGGGIGGGLVWGLASGLAPETRLFAGAIAAWIGAIVLTFLGARRIESARAAQWPADDPRRMTRRIEIDEAGFVSRGAEFETRIAWAGVESIRETEQHILFITRWKEIYAVPMRCFPNADAGHAFANKARAFKTAF